MLYDSITIGPFLIKNLWIVLFIAGLVSYIVMEIRIRKFPDLQPLLLNEIGNGLVICLLLYKFSIVLFRPSILFTNPQGILFFTGGIKGLVLGLLIGILYLGWQIKKNKFKVKNVFDVLGFGMLTSLTTYYLLVTFLYEQ
ncbi:hypothetical protein IMZ08_11125 [Bacillus luteolus]|uniref:Uncharacterized protein n=1 Tax=Litchfieldia luteola TaxID=682179 RepID=A0ABR9QKA6_9BACI|nr:hypothetical protein [Cytobacillus luteolus]MBE4908609.1 hypothetical protein [Cytobacillus luteolus]MBP1941464.1 hypothetical protein [Cytobacillus luteolus]